jgi:hypothetical protein
MSLTITLKSTTEQAVRTRAAAVGKTADDFAAELVERAISRSSLREILAPIHQQTTASGMTDGEIDTALQNALEVSRFQSNRNDFSA